MFQMSKQLFDQCWPAIAMRIEAEKSAAQAGSICNDRMPPARSPNTVAEADYVLGVAIGYALQVDHVMGAPVSISAPGWSADACGQANCPLVAMVADVPQGRVTSVGLMSEAVA